MKIIFCALIGLSSLAYADREFIELMAPGQYLLVGKRLDSNETYHGTVEIKSSANEMIVLRRVGNRTTKGLAKVEPVLDGDAHVLRIRFVEDGISYEQTCLLSSDLDNEARISCYLYKPAVMTKQPGLEVLFHDHNKQ